MPLKFFKQFTQRKSFFVASYYSLFFLLFVSLVLSSLSHGRLEIVQQSDWRIFFKKILFYGVHFSSVIIFKYNEEEKKKTEAKIYDFFLSNGISLKITKLLFISFTSLGDIRFEKEKNSHFKFHYGKLLVMVFWLA